jgi:hypothetical protein
MPGGKRADGLGLKNDGYGKKEYYRETDIDYG